VRDTKTFGGQLRPLKKTRSLFKV